MRNLIKEYVEEEVVGLGERLGRVDLEEGKVVIRERGDEEIEGIKVEN